jgi:fucose permease
VGFVLVGSLCPFLREALADKSQKKRSYLLDPLEISTTFIYFAIITIDVAIIIIIINIISHGFERENPECSITTLCFFSGFCISGIPACPCLKPLSEKTKRSLPLICPCSWKAEFFELF